LGASHIDALFLFQPIMTDRSAPNIIGVGAIFIDDIVLPDGTTHMNRLGGGVVHAMMGAALWEEYPGLVALAGNDLAIENIEYLRQYMDLRGLFTLEIPQIRAWQIFENDGTRTELYRVKDTAQFINGATPSHYPNDYTNSKGLYLLQDFDGIRAWSQHLTEKILLWEPNANSMLPENRRQMRDVLHKSDIDIVSPNLDEARKLYGNLTPEKIIDALFDDYANIVVLRMGGDGSLIAKRNSNIKYEIGVVKELNILDQTGAGNTYCGAFLTGILRDKSLMEAGVMGAVAASFCMESVGVLSPVSIDQMLRDIRYMQLLKQTQMQ
jgi:sugar/nucleoside kinase (ribokinase family)